MQRTVEEIRGELAAHDGQKGMGRVIGALRKELLDALEAENEALKDEVAALKDGLPTQPVSIPWGNAGCVSSGTAMPNVFVSTAGGPDPFQSDEWRFIEKACQEIHLSKAGSTTGLAKYLYNELDAKVRLYRLAREIVQQVGVGNDWPQWVALGRNDSTGKLKPADEKPAPAPAPAAPATPKVTEAGMPIRSSRPSPQDILAQVTGGSPKVGITELVDADMAAVPGG